jgi:hypothetical protein
VAVAVAAVGARTTPLYALDFTFAVIADPHIDGKADHVEYLRKAVDNISATKAARNTVLAVVLGDIAWGGSGGANLATARSVLDQLNAAGIPYVPVVGDNDCYTSIRDQEFHEAFAPQYAYLASRLTKWEKAPTPVEGKYLQNFSFDWGNCHFVAADFAARPGSDQGTLNDFAGGTWPWFTHDIQTCAKPKEKNIVILSHFPLLHTGVKYFDQFLFPTADFRTLVAFIELHRAHVAANYAGHIHQNYACNVTNNSTPLYRLQTTDETWIRQERTEFLGDPGCTVRYVGVTTEGGHVSYEQSLVTVP